METSSQDGCLEELAEIELFTANLWHFEIVDSEIFLEVDESILELLALDFLVVRIDKLELLW